MNIKPEMISEISDRYSLRDLLELSIQKRFKWHETFVLKLALTVLEALKSKSPTKKELNPTHFFLPAQIFIHKEGTITLEDVESLALDPKKDVEILRYSPLEFHHGFSKDDEKHLLYALGVLLYELCAGEKVFIADTPEDIHIKIKSHDFDESHLIAKGYSLSLIEFIFSMIEKNVNKRIQSLAAAFESVEDNLLKKQFIPETVLWDEVLRLLQFHSRANDDLELKSELILSKKRRVPPHLRVKVAMISLFCIVLCIVVFLFSKDQSDLQLFYVLDKNVVEVRGINVAKEVPFNIIPSSCELVDHDLLNPIKVILSDKGVSENEFDFSIGQFFQYSVLNGNMIQNKISELKKICADTSKTLKNADIFENYFQSLNKIRSADLKSVGDLRERLKVMMGLSLVDIDKILSTDFPESQNSLALGHLQYFDSHLRLGFDSLILDEEFFPQSLSECQNLIDQYWVQNQFLTNHGDAFFKKLNVILIPLHLNSRLEKTAWNRIQIHFESIQSQDAVKPKNENICVYRRENGILKEISFRSLRKNGSGTK